MYISIRGAFVRNLAAAVVNGAITLVILLIAPLGLASVITNTGLIAISTFLVCSGGDLIVLWLSNAAPPRNFARNQGRNRGRYRDQELEFRDPSLRSLEEEDF